MKVQLKRVEFDITATAPRSITVKKWIRRWLLGVIIDVCGLPGLLDTNEDVNVVLKKVPAPVRPFLELVFIPVSFGLLVIGTSAAAEIKIDLQLFKLINFHVIRKDDRVGGLSRFLCPFVHSGHFSFQWYCYAQPRCNMPQDNTIWATYASLGVQALIPIAIGSFKSLKVRLFRKFRCQ